MRVDHPAGAKDSPRVGDVAGERHVLQPEHTGEVVATAELDLSAMDLKTYELVAYHAEATDNNTLDGPGTGKSPVYFIEITDEEAANRAALDHKTSMTEVSTVIRFASIWPTR